MRHLKNGFMPKIWTTLLLFTLLLGCLWGCGKKETVDYGRYQQDIARLQAEIDELQAEIDEPLAGLTPNPVTVIGLSGAYESVYTYVFPLLQKAGMPGVVVLEDGRMPGEEGMMTLDQAKEMISAGWEFALGDCGEIVLLDQSGEAPSGEWKAYLDDCLSTMQNLGLPTPITFCFGLDRYHPAAEQALADRGIKVIRHSFSDTNSQALKVREELYAKYQIEMYGRAVADSGLVYRVGGALIRADGSTAQLNVETAIKQKAVVSVAAGRVLPSVTDHITDCTLEKFTLMVSSLMDYRKKYGLEVMTFSGMYDYKTGFESDLDHRIAEYDAMAAELQAEIEKRRTQIEQLMKEMLEEGHK